jgi:hypothetical protein
LDLSHTSCGLELCATVTPEVPADWRDGDFSHVDYFRMDDHPEVR